MLCKFSVGMVGIVVLMFGVFNSFFDFFLGYIWVSGIFWSICGKWGSVSSFVKVEYFWICIVVICCCCIEVKFIGGWSSCVLK